MPFSQTNSDSEYSETSVVVKRCQSRNRSDSFEADGDVSAPSQAKSAANGFASVLLSIAVAFWPKCPFCWAYYMSLFGIAGMKSIPFSPWMKPLIVLALGVNLIVLYRRSVARDFRIPFYVSCAGAALILMAGYMNAPSLVSKGLIFVVSGAVLNSLPVHTIDRWLRTRFALSKARMAVADL